MNFYISDTHFGHYNIIKHCNRPFASAEEMDKAIIENWNKVVTEKDVVYILGDVAFSKGTNPANYLQQLKGRKIIILGNHDYDIANNRKKYANLVYKICNYLEISEMVNNKPCKIVMSHYPMAEWNGFFRGAIHLYGHVHNNKENPSYQIMKNLQNAYNVGADILDFTPRKLEEIVKFNKNFFS